MSDRATSFALTVAVVLTTLAFGCEPSTALFITIDSNLEVPVEMDGLDLLLTASRDAAGGLCAPAGRELPLEEQDALPVVIGVEPGVAQDEWIALRIVGRLEGSEVLRLERVASLPDDDLWQIEIFLDRQCIGVICANDEHCLEGFCEVVPLPGIFDEAATSETSCGDFERGDD